jgi:tetratricopeptide (TPR) repeat protein
MFKHALTQEVVYNSLLKKERCGIHEQIARVIETVFKDRLTEFSETLAYHFARGKSTAKAINYMIKSGEKSLARYSVVEANQYFRKAYDILSSKKELSETEKKLLIDILNSWGYAFYYLGDFEEFISIFSSHQAVADSIKDKDRVGMFYVWYGFAHWNAGKAKDSYGFLCKGLQLGEKATNQKVVGYACAFLSWTCGDLGHFAEGIDYGERALKIAESFPSDQYLFFKPLAAICMIYFYTGDTRRIFEGAELLSGYGERNANNRSKVLGHCMKAAGHLAVGDMELSQKSSERASKVALDPYYSQYPKIGTGMAYLFGGQIKEAENVLQSAINSYEKSGVELFSIIGRCFLAPVLIAKGHMQQGIDLAKKAQNTLIRNQRKTHYAMSEYILGEVYLQIATGPRPSLSILARNIGFLLKNVPFATRKSEKHFNKAIALFKEIGVKGFLGQVYLSQGLLYKATKRSDQARQAILEAINLFRECEAEIWLKKANEALVSLG